MRGKIVLALTFGLAACGVDTFDIGKISKDENSSRELVPITIPVNMVDVSSFSLAPATNFEMTMDSCVSGHTATADETTGSLDVYKFDQGCLAKLTSFTSAGITYDNVSAGAVDFTTWLAGDTATFSDGTNTIAVTVVAQLDSPISGTEPITYSFTTAEAGTGDTIADTTVGDSHVITVAGDDAPDVEIISHAFVGMTALGAGQFDFEFECQAAIAGNDCSGQDMTTYEWALEDANSFATPGVPSLAELDALTMDATVGAVDGANGTNGGIDAPTLDGPDAMHTNPNMVLIVKSGASYKYFTVDVTVLSEVQDTP